MNRNRSVSVVRLSSSLFALLAVPFVACVGTAETPEPKPCTKYTWYVDSDRDGHGNPDVALAQAACEQPDGFVGKSDDCNDKENKVHPGAAESCDRVDSDCSANGGVETSEDVDNDGLSAPTAACTGGFPKTDCDETTQKPTANQKGVCKDAKQTCVLVNGTETFTDSYGPNYEAQETKWSDGLDNDCDGVVDEKEIIQITAGGSHTCVLFADHKTVKCWGANEAGQLGTGDTVARGATSASMTNLPAVNFSGATIHQVVSGKSHTCARGDDGKVWCWGANPSGALGLGDMRARTAPTPVDLGVNRTAIDVAVGSESTCAILENGRVKCWGGNSGRVQGYLGLGDDWNRGDEPGEMGDALPEVNLGTGRTAVRLSAASNHVCATLDDRSTKCWGFNGYGELGTRDTLPRGTTSASMGDALLPLLSSLDPNAIVSGGRCVFSAAAAPSCWGRNDEGQLGRGTTDAWVGPAEADVGSYGSLLDGNRAPISTAGLAHACLVGGDKKVRCWGANGSGQLGIGSTAARGDAFGEMGTNLIPVPLATSDTPAHIAGGYFHTCIAYENSDLVYCWGSNSAGQLGIEDTNNRGDDPNEMGANLPPVKLW